MAMSQNPNLLLHSPAGAPPMSYKWPLQMGSGADRHDNGIEILDTIKWVCEDMPEIQATIEDINMNEIDTTCYDEMRDIVDTYNKAIDSVLTLEKGTSLPNQRLNKYASKDMLRHVIQLVYNTAVTEPEKLNQYEPFSPEVYGETSYDLICQMIEQINVKPDDVFIDLGSGVGQVVLQMAGSLPLASCIGIERADVPSSYAENMDLEFKRWMKWFGKRFNNYTLIKGDFLDQEHREKIGTASIVFVNNFAFGPNVDHKLKERFAELPDAARIVSSKSYCPLSFRITERNLTDIGTIMNVSEMSPLKGSVSWTGKPVSYYLHIIDRRKLERYFELQRLKSQKGNDDSNNSNSRTSRSTRNNAIKMDDTTDSDQDGMNSNSGRSTRKAWNEFCNYKENSNSDDEENNNSNSLKNNKNGAAPKKRKKLTRKAATKASQPPTVAVQKKRAGVKAAAATNHKKGRKRNLKIVGLDLLHSHTLSSTSTEVLGKKLPPAPGCVDQKLTSLTAGDMLHQELDIPTAPRETPYALQILLDMYRNQFLQALDQMKSPAYKENVSRQIADEKERHKNLLNRASQLEKQIKVLIDDSVSLLKTRMNELGISMTSQNDLLAKAKEIVGRHKELQIMAAKLQNQVSQIEQEQNSLIMSQMQTIATHWAKKNNLNEFELNPQTSHDLVLKEIANTLSYRKKLQAQVSTLESDMHAIESAAASAANALEEKKASAITNSNIIITPTATLTPTANNGPLVINIQSQPQPSTSSSSIALQAPLQTSKQHHNQYQHQHQQQQPQQQHAGKSQRKSRDHRTRSQEWPDVPDVGKIEENNPEILAQKILETGRQIEAGRLITSNSYKYKEGSDQRKASGLITTGDASLMPAPMVIKATNRSNPITTISTAPLAKQQYNVAPIAVNAAPKMVPDTPKVVNFESRLKSIITSVLNEDQEQRKAQTKPTPPSVSAIPIVTAMVPAQPTYPKSYPQTAANQQPGPPHGFIYNPNNYVPTNPNIITGTHQLNAATTISAVKSLPPTAPSKYSAGVVANKYPAQPHQMPQQQQTSTSPRKYDYGKSRGSEKAACGFSESSHPPPPSQYYMKSGPNEQPINHNMGHVAVNSLAYQQHQREKMAMEHHPHYPQMLEVKSEFKAPDKMRFERTVANHNMPIDDPHYHMSRVTMQTAETHYQSGRSSVSSVGHHPSRPPSSTSSSPALPDYTQVSPAKMALRRHLSQEKLTQPVSAQKTIGDLVNGEIERTLEISNQSIINAAINMSSLGGARPPSTASIGAVINISAQRPERVNVRVIDDPIHNAHPQYTQIPGYREMTSPALSDCPQGRVAEPSRARSSRSAGSHERVTKSPVHLHGQSNLATLAQVAYNHKPNQHPQQMPSVNSMAQISPRANGAAYQPPNLSHRYPLTPQTPSTVLLGALKHAPRGMLPLESYNSGPNPSAALLQADYSQSQPQPAPQKYMPLPRADMKPHLESYFADEQKAMIMQQREREQMNHTKNMIDEKPRNNGAPPLEGLAASLHARVVAEMKIKEEHEKRNEMNMTPIPMVNGSVTITATHQIKIEDAGLKRSSPIIHHHRPTKMRHYSDMNDSLLSPDSQHHSGRHSTTLELMSPEINSMASEDRTHIRKHEDDDVGDDESHWQDRVSSGFDRLVAFASTELTKSRRSIEEGAPSTSPDSGINHSSDGRTFLSSSSSSSQLDAPTHLMRNVVPIMKSSPIEPPESPPLSELPRTPSPSASPPPLSLYSQSPILIESTTKHHENSCKIPLKYQRQSKSQSQKHYKKKFRDRTWEYDDYDKDINDGLDDTGSDRGSVAGSHYGNLNDVDFPLMSNSTSSSMLNAHHLHKSSKFRPKGKDWWRNEHHRSDNHETDTAHA